MFKLKLYCKNEFWNPSGPGCSVGIFPGCIHRYCTNLLRTAIKVKLQPPEERRHPQDKASCTEELAPHELEDSLIKRNQKVGMLA